MIGTIIEIFATLTDVLFMIWFVPKFNGVSLKKRPVALVWAGVLLIFQLVADRLLQGMDLLYAAIDFLLVLCFSLSLEKKKRLWQAFSAFVYVIVIMLVSTLGFTVFSLFTENFAELVQGDISYVRLIYLLVCKMIHLSFYRLLLLLFKKENKLDIKNGMLSFLFTIVTAFGLGILLELASVLELGKMGVLVSLLAILFIVLNVILYLMLNQLQGLLKSKYELSLVQERMESERSRIEDASVIWNNIRKLKHDLKNHFTVLRGKLEEGDSESCKNYLSELNQTVESMGDLIRSGNSVIDYLINSKLSGMDNVRILVSGYVGNYSDIEDVDLACILGNILDNAIEAQKDVESDKRIELHFLMKNSSRVIICKNTISDSVLDNNSLLRSTKEAPELHGLGHQIVETTVKKYRGWVDYFEEDGMFGVQIILPL